MKREMKHNIALLIVVLMIMIWTTLMLYISGTNALQSCQEQQKGKAGIVAGFFKQFILHSNFSDLYDINYQLVKEDIYETEYSVHIVLYRIAHKILSSAAIDETIEWIAVIDKNGFVPWAWSRNNTKIYDGLISKELSNKAFYALETALDHNEHKIISALIPCKRNKDWGYVIVAYNPSIIEQQKAIRSYAMTIILSIAILITIFWKSLNRIFWRRFWK